ncbi:hypothetical protein [Streptomyces sp. S1D4-20]|uniref:hypothetical protein n=1 Tax=Streptomyces sp. S1D4-20 TaxID=2594462 RepID=UPI0011622DFE|nr:hypothetical protein [Streptomyces sp. S1D4-20]QDN54097.1 hypothetical protein FNV67_00515 [Streptomyces sp. S1D4-20]
MDPSTSPPNATSIPLAEADLRCLEDRSDTELATIRARVTEILVARRQAAAAGALRDLLPRPHPPQTGLARALVQPDRTGQFVLHYDGGGVRALTLDTQRTLTLNAAIAGLVELGTEMIAGRLLIRMSALAPADLPCAVCDATACGAPDSLPDGRCAACEAHLHHEHRLLGVNCSEFIPF